MLLLLFQHTRFFFLFSGVAINGAEPTAHHPFVAGKALLLLLLPQVFSRFSAKNMDETVIVSIKNYITRSFFLWPPGKRNICSLFRRLAGTVVVVVVVIAHRIACIFLLLPTKPISTHNMPFTSRARCAFAHDRGHRQPDWNDASHSGHLVVSV